MATEDEVAAILAVAAATYPNFKIQVGPQAFATAWLRHVGHLPAPQLQAAFDRAVHGSEFFPTVYDVLKAAHQVEQGDGPTALEAWSKVKKMMAVMGNYHPPKPGPYPLMENHREWEFDDPRTAAAVQGLGWANLFEGDEDVMRSHFIRAYDGMALREMSRALAVPALGGAPVPLKKLLATARAGQP